MSGSLRAGARAPLTLMLIPVSLLLFFTGCVTREMPQRMDGALKITDTSHKTSFASITFKKLSGIADYQFAGAGAKAQWIACQSAAATGTVVVMHRDEAGFDETKFCESWTAQAFLRSKFNVITVNRPGYVGSSGPEDFSGPKSIAAIDAGVKAASAQISPVKPVIGFYGYSSGAIAAAFYSKKVPTAQWVILGNGMYDLETVAKETKGTYVQKELAAISKAEGKVALENRSIAYDLSGLPKRVALYHGKANTISPVSQAQAFRDTLASSEYVVTLDVLDGVAHELNPGHHRQILEVLVRAVQMPGK